MWQYRLIAHMSYQLLIRKIIEPSLKEMSHILKDTFDFVERTKKDLEMGTVHGVADIKSFYTNTSHDLGLKVEDLQRFTKNFIIEGMSIILKYNYFNINSNFNQQVKGTATGTHAAVVQASLTCGYLEVKLFNKLPEIFSYDFLFFY